MSATRLPRDRMFRWIEDGGGWTVQRGEAWESLGHGVDRMIKRRDIVVAARAG